MGRMLRGRARARGESGGRPWRRLGARTGRVLVVAAGVAAVVAAPSTASAPTDYTWSGAGATSDWSNATNWGGGAPSGSVGVFSFPALTGSDCTSNPPAATCYQSTNDQTGISASGISIDDGVGYAISGNAVALGAGGLTAAPSSSDTGAGFPSLNLPITLDSSQTWSITGGPQNQQVIVGGAVSGTSDALTVDFSGQSGLMLSSDDEVGAFSASGPGTVALSGSLNGGDQNTVSFSGGAGLFASAPGAASGPLSIAGGQLEVGQGITPDSPTDGTLAVSGGVTLDSSSTLLMHIDKAGTTPSTDYSQMTATGNVILGGSTLVLSAGPGASCPTLTANDVYTLVTTTGSLSGTFAGLPGGSTTQLGPCASGTPPTLRIDYTPDSVTATVVGSGSSTPTQTVLSPNPSSPVTNQSVTLTATVSPSAATGTVAFEDGSSAIPGCASVAVNSGIATCKTSFTAATSPESLNAVFTPTSGSSYASSTATLSLAIAKDSTTTTLAVSTAAPALGQSVTFTATVTPTPHSGSVLPTGSVEFLDGATAIGTCSTQPLSAGKATCTVSYSSPTGDYSWSGRASLASGGLDWSSAASWAAGVAPSPVAHGITAKYLSDANFAGSTSALQTVTSPAVGTLSFGALASCNPSTDACYQSHNDLTGLSASQISLDPNAGYAISGNSITLGAGGLTAAPSTSDTSTGVLSNLDLPITLGAAQTWSITGGANGEAVNVDGRVTGTGHNLTVDFFANKTSLDLAGDDQVGAFSASGNGTVALVSGSLNGRDGNVISFSGGAGLFVGAPGITSGPLSISGGPLNVGQGLSPDGTLSVSGGVTLDSSSTLSMYIDQAGTTPSTDFSQLTATGTVSLSGATLSLGGPASGACPALQGGDVYTLVKTTGSLSGTFAGLPDGRTTQLQCGAGSGRALRINYTSDSVTATVLIPTTTTLTASPVNPTNNQTVTLTATVSPSSAIGTVAFANGGAVIPDCEQVPVSAGTATCTTSFTLAAAGFEQLSAVFAPATGSAFEGSTGTLSLVVGAFAASLRATTAPNQTGGRLVQTDIDGCDSPGAGSYSWTIDGDPFFPSQGAAQCSFDHGFSVGTHTVSLTVSESSGTRTATTTIQVSVAPVAGFTWTVKPNHVGQDNSYATVALNACATSGGIARYSWRVRSGQIRSGRCEVTRPLPNHTSTKVTLRVTATNGQVLTETYPVYVDAPLLNATSCNLWSLGPDGCVRQNIAELGDELGVNGSRPPDYMVIGLSGSLGDLLNATGSVSAVLTCDGSVYGGAGLGAGAGISLVPIVPIAEVLSYGWVGNDPATPAPSNSVIDNFVQGASLNVGIAAGATGMTAIIGGSGVGYQVDTGVASVGVSLSASYNTLLQRGDGGRKCVGGAPATLVFQQAINTTQQSASGLQSVNLSGPSGGTSLTVGAGVTFNVVSSDWQAGTEVTVLAHSKPVVLAKLPANDLGQSSIDVSLHAGFQPGHHTLIETGWAPDGRRRRLAVPFTVTSAATLQRRPRVGSRKVSFAMACARDSRGCHITAMLMSRASTLGKRVVRPPAAARRAARPLLVGKRTVTIPGGRTRTITIRLNGAGDRLLGRFGRLPVTLAIALTGGGWDTTIATVKLTLKSPPVRASRRSLGRGR